MKNILLVVIAGLVLLTAATICIGADTNSVEVKGQSTDVGVNTFTWDHTNFAWFYYDNDKNIGAETITFRLSGATPTGATLSDQPDANNNRGVVYQTQAQLKTFKYKAWGQYEII